MRSTGPLATGPLAAGSLWLAATGCNAIFGLDAVSQRGEGGATSATSATGTGGGATTSSSSAGRDGGGGASSACPPGGVAGDLLNDGSFEQDGTWDLHGAGATLEHLPATDCAFACGARVAHVTAAAAAETATIQLQQDVSHTLELGSTLRLGAHYRYTTSDAKPYFSFAVNGYNVGTGSFYGQSSGDAWVLDAFEVPVTDPRRTGYGGRLSLVQDLATGDTADLLADCVSLTYEAPPGDQLLTDGWFESGVGGFTESNEAQLAWGTSGGLCGAGAASVTVPFDNKIAEIRRTVAGAWEVGTTFAFGGAMQPIPPAVFNFVLFFSLGYSDGAQPQSEDFEVTVLSSSEAWESATAAVTATRPVSQATIRISSSNESGADANYLADCFSVRAISP